MAGLQVRKTNKAMDATDLQIVIMELKKKNELLFGNSEKMRKRTAEFRAFKINRKKSIEAVDDFSKKMINLSNGANTADAVGNVTMFVSAIGFGVGFGVSVCGNPIAGRSIMKVSQCGMVGGQVISLGATLIESGFSSSYLRTLKETLRKDWETSQKLLDWNKEATGLNRLAEDVFGFELESPKRNDYMSIWDCFLDIVGELSIEFSLLIRQIQKMLSHRWNISGLVGDISGALRQSYDAIRENPKLRKSFCDVHTIVRNNSVMFMANTSFLKAQALSFNVYQLVTAYGGDFMSTSNLAAFGILNVARAAYAVQSILENVKNIREDNHRYAEDVKKLTEFLKADYLTYKTLMDNYRKKKY